MQQDSTSITQSFTAPRSFLNSEVVSRSLAALVLGIFVWRVYGNYAVDHNPGLLILLLSELFTFGLVLFARVPKQANRSLFAWGLVLVSIFYALAIKLSNAGSVELLPASITVPLQSVGFIFQVSTKAWLGRSFGLLPENRGIVTNGPYRLVRHPIYLGYLLNHIGFLLSHFNLWNLFVLAILYVCQILRMIEEEKVLRLDPEYLRYMRRTKKRLVPFVY